MAYATEAMQGGLSAGTALAIGGQGASVAAAGSAITDATVVKASISIVTAADGNKGVKLVGSIGDRDGQRVRSEGHGLHLWKAAELNHTGHDAVDASNVHSGVGASEV